MYVYTKEKEQEKTDQNGHLINKNTTFSVLCMMSPGHFNLKFPVLKLAPGYSLYPSLVSISPP